MTAARVAWHEVTRVHPAVGPTPAVRALDALTLSADAGQLLAMVGPSGSGKSTALRVLAGIEPFDAGSVHIGEVEVSDTPAHQRDVAMVFQDLALFPHLTVADNVLFGPTVRRLPPPQRAALLQEVAEPLGLEDLLDRRPRELSGGQAQRVALARAMVRHPAVFLLDEPLSNLDTRLRIEARAQIVALQRRLGTTMVYVTHDQAEAMTMGDRIAVLRDGALQQVGTPRSLYDRPATTFVATFLGSPPMNLLPADCGLAPSPAKASQVGIRAEDLVVTDGADSHGPVAGSLAGTVAQVEDLGSEILLLLDTPHGTIHVRRPARMPVAPGTPVRIGVSSEVHLHHFDSGGMRV